MKAISPVIATVIIVAVAISISIAVALWITGLTSTFTGVEKLEIVNAHATYDSQNNQWNVDITVKNTGTKPATIEHVYANNNEITSFTLGHGDNVLDIGETDTITFSLSGQGYDHGVTVSIIIVTGSGGRYPVTITLP